jgi:hypothetical protein
MMMYSNPLKSTKTTSANNNNSTAQSTIKPRSFIPNENILKKASIFNNIHN